MKNSRNILSGNKLKWEINAVKKKYSIHLNVPDLEISMSFKKDEFRDLVLKLRRGIECLMTVGRELHIGGVQSLQICLCTLEIQCHLIFTVWKTKLSTGNNFSPIHNKPHFLYGTLETLFLKLLDIILEWNFPPHQETPLFNNAYKLL